MPPSPPRDARTTGPFDLAQTPIHLGFARDGESGALPLEGFGFDGPSFEAYIKDHCPDGASGRLLMIETSPTDWPVWECHTHGDEIVIVLEGEAELVHEIEGEQRRIAVGPGSTVINPKGVWHTADVTSPLRAVYVTPIAGTEHRPR